MMCFYTKCRKCKYSQWRPVESINDLSTHCGECGYKINWHRVNDMYCSEWEDYDDEEDEKENEKEEQNKRKDDFVQVKSTEHDNDKTSFERVKRIEKLYEILKKKWFYNK